MDLFPSPYGEKVSGSNYWSAPIKGHTKKFPSPYGEKVSGSKGPRDASATYRGQGCFHPLTGKRYLVEICSSRHSSSNKTVSIPLRGKGIWQKIFSSAACVYYVDQFPSPYGEKVSGRSQLMLIYAETQAVSIPLRGKGIWQQAVLSQLETHKLFGFHPLTGKRYLVEYPQEPAVRPCRFQRVSIPLRGKGIWQSSAQKPQQVKVSEAKSTQQIFIAIIDLTIQTLTGFKLLSDKASTLSNQKIKVSGFSLIASIGKKPGISILNF